MSPRPLSILLAFCSLTSVAVEAQEPKPAPRPSPQAEPSPPSQVVPNGEVQITVLAANNEKPVSGATVTLTGVADKSLKHSLISNAQGLVYFKNLPPGDYSVQITEPHHDPDKTARRCKGTRILSTAASPTAALCKRS
jgi:hypothetical protein